jgi:hypothetical protein
MRGARVLLVAVLAAAAAALLAPPAGLAAARKVPRGWLGVTFGPQIAVRHSSVDRELREMRRSGVESVRVAVYWFQLQPYARRANVPRSLRSSFRRQVGGHPISFRALDALVAAAARYGLPVAPVVLGAPGWATDDPLRPISEPRDPEDYARLMTALVRRYGNTGAFWSSHRAIRRRPVQQWQIWNEVSNSWYWDGTWADSYPRLLRAAYDAVKQADPRAQVLMSGLNTTGAGQASGSFASWTALDRIYGGLDRQGLGRPFDATAAHIYTRTVAQAVKVVQETRKVMDDHGDDRPIDVTELAWPASKGKLRDARGRKRTFFAETDQRGMARRLAQGVRALASHRTQLNIGGVDWYQWISPYSGTTDAFSYAGLRRAHRRGIDDMPALKAFRRVASRLEGRRLP